MVREMPKGPGHRERKPQARVQGHSGENKGTCVSPKEASDPAWGVEEGFLKEGVLDKGD